MPHGRILEKHPLNCLAGCYNWGVWHFRRQRFVSLVCVNAYNYMGVEPKIGGKPKKWMVKIMEHPIKMDDLGVPLFLETPIWLVKFAGSGPSRDVDGVAAWQFHMTTLTGVTVQFCYRNMDVWCLYLYLLTCCCLHYSDNSDRVGKCCMTVRLWCCCCWYWWCHRLFFRMNNLWYISCRFIAVSNDLTPKKML